MNYRGLLLLGLAALGLGGCEFQGKYKSEVEGEFGNPKPKPTEVINDARNDSGNDGIGENGTIQESSENASK
jgi:hypothetical protein